MRISEIHYATRDDLIVEGWLDDVKNTVGARINDTIDAVRNTTDALAVFFKIGTDAHFLETSTFLMKKQVNLAVKNLGPLRAKISPLVTRVYPQGRRLSDFIKSCILVAGLRYLGTLAGKMRSMVEDGIKETISNTVKKLVNIDSMLGSLSRASGVFTILDSLGIANEYLFSVLADVNTKIKSSVAEARPN